jgi:TIR domain
VNNFNIHNSNIEQLNNQGDNVKIVGQVAKDATDGKVEQPEGAQPGDLTAWHTIPPSPTDTGSTFVTSESGQPGTSQLAMESLHTSAPIRLFYSYSHKDEALRDKLEESLAVLKRQGHISVWHDRRIGAGEDWKGAIDKNLEKAQVVLLLVSASFLASDYCYDIEMKSALERHARGEARVIPVILRPVDWHGAPFAKLQALPKDGKPIVKWRPRDDGYRNVVEGIRRVIEDLARNPR